MEKIKKFVYYYRYAWKLFLLDMVCATGIAGLSLTFPIMTRQFMKEFIPNKQIDLMIRWSIALVGLYLVRLVLQYVVNYWGHVVGVRMEFAMRRDLFNHLQTLDCSFYDDTPSLLMSRIVSCAMSRSWPTDPKTYSCHVNADRFFFVPDTDQCSVDPDCLCVRACVCLVCVDPA